MTEKQDLSSEEIMNTIRLFTPANRHRKLAILVMMSHGDKHGNILCADGSVCEVQDAIHVFSQDEEQEKVCAGSPASLF